MGVPAVLFVDAAENEIAARVVGVRSAKDFLNDLKQRTQR
jgi:thiol:disulfide interchange protein